MDCHVMIFNYVIGLISLLIVVIALLMLVGAFLMARRS